MPKTTYMWDELSDNVAAEYENGVLSVAYTHEPGLYGNLLSQNRNGVTSYYHFDGRGDTVALTDDSGSVTDTKEYDAWGNVIASTGSTVTPYQFVGRGGYQSDVLNGTAYVRARSYSMALGRWLSPDPQFYEPNRYLYTMQSPLWRIDVSGLEWTQLADDINIYQSSAGEDSLQSLAMQITGRWQDWVCIWPVGSKGWSSYPMADECGAKADVSNLLAIDGGEYVHAIQNYNKQKDGRMHGNDAYVIAMRILFGIAPARTWRDGNEAAKQFAQQSGQGATPLKLYGVIGHGAGDERICDQNGDHCYTTNDIFAVAKEKSNERNSFSNARKRIGPPKCWLTRSANVFGVACTSAATWAPEWADQIARIGVTVNGANGLLEGEYPGNRSNARVWFQESEEDTYGSATQFLASPYWVHSSGRQ